MGKLSTLIVSLIVSFTGLVCNGTAYADSAVVPSFKTISISPAIKMLQGKGGNIGLLNGPQGILLIADDYQAMSGALREALLPYGGVEKLTYIVNTHGHGDHTGGNKDLGHDAVIVAHDNVRARLLTRQEVKLFNMVSAPYPSHAVPSITYQKRMSMHINGQTIQLIHFANGHTDGDSVVWFADANVIHMGDHFFNGTFPFVDVAGGG